MTVEDPAGVPFTATLEDGFTYLGVEGGGVKTDVNNDGVTDAVDVQLVVNALLGMDKYTVNADVDGNGEVDAADVQLVVNGVLGL